jgi:transposase-like protein
VSKSDTDKPEVVDRRSEETRSFVRQIRAATRRKYTAEEKIRIVLEGFRREVTVNDLCRREGIKPHSYYAWARAEPVGSDRYGWGAGRCVSVASSAQRGGRYSEVDLHSPPWYRRTYRRARRGNWSKFWSRTSPGSCTKQKGTVKPDCGTCEGYVKEC